MNLKIRTVDFLVYSFWIIFFVAVLLKYPYAGADPFVVITFFIIGIVAFIMSIREQRNVSIKRNYYIFCLIFFFFAPLQQYLSKTRLWSGNGMSVVYTDNDYLIVNLLILISMVLFEIGYAFGLRRKRRKRVKQMIEEEKVDEYVERNYKASTFLLLTITLASVGIIVATRGMSNIISESAMMSQVKHMILFAPIICIIVSLINVKNGNLKAKKYLYFIAFITIAVFLLYSGTMARFILLGAIMAVVSCALLDYKNKSLYFSLYIAGFFFAFSMLRQKNLLDGNLLSFVDFRQADYDAYQIFILVVRYVKEYGISWGLNILSAVCCFIPRSIATWRMEATGGIVVSSAGSWFKNVSCPLQAEMYFAFGIFGVIILSVLLGLLVCWLDSRCEEESHFYKGLFAILSGVTLYVMRGSLLPTFSFTVGIMLAYWGVYNCVYSRVKLKG